MGHRTPLPHHPRRLGPLARLMGAALLVSVVTTAPARADHDFGEVDYLADQLETVSRNVWIHSKDHRHHHDYAEQQAIKRLRHLSWAAEDFHRTVDDRFGNVYAVEHSFDGLAQTFFLASDAFPDLCVGYTEREEFGYVRTLMDELFRYYNPPRRRQFDAYVIYHGGRGYSAGPRPHRPHAHGGGHGGYRAPRRQVAPRPAPRRVQPHRHAQPAPQRRVQPPRHREGHHDGGGAAHTRPPTRNPQHRPQAQGNGQGNRNRDARPQQQRGWREGERPQRQAQSREGAQDRRRQEAQGNQGNGNGKGKGKGEGNRGRGRGRGRGGN